MEFDDRIPKLIARYLRGELTTSEKKELDDWINEKEANKVFFAEATNEKWLAEELRHFNKKDRTPVLNIALQTIDPEVKPTNKGKLRQMKRYMAAACLILLAGTALYLFTDLFNKKGAAETATNTDHLFKNDIAPGTDKAILTLADGSTIQLDNAGNKRIADENGTAVNQQGAQLVYEAGQSSSINQATLSYNVLSTPRGGQYQLVLPDGSRVWLNAVSSIRYPVAFIGKGRNVEITGEAYFEIAKDPQKPFKVKANGTTTEVLGTHFNVNAYNDESSVQTTLLEGKVKVSALNGKDNNQKILSPGQQAQLNTTGEIKLNNPDIEEVMAWKNEVFFFQGKDIVSIMRSIERWYDVDVEFKGTITNRKFYVDIQRSVSVSKVLEILKKTGWIDFKIEGKKITAIPFE